uniref:DUF3298 domain-containing protein n=1 Tax=Heterorhabditis bacteriophora TaxID=37862 RepID=A0A1I7X2M3_HETBA
MTRPEAPEATETRNLALIANSYHDKSTGTLIPNKRGVTKRVRYPKDVAFKQKGEKAGIKAKVILNIFFCVNHRSRDNLEEMNCLEIMPSMGLGYYCFRSQFQEKNHIANDVVNDYALVKELLGQFYQRAARKYGNDYNVKIITPYYEAVVFYDCGIDKTYGLKYELIQADIGLIFLKTTYINFYPPIPLF